jgi:uncharacterized protein YecE (DUF72 family)
LDRRSARCSCSCRRPSFDARRVGRFLDLRRARHADAVVCEPRHVTCTSPAAARLLSSFRIARVAADPPRAAGLETPGGWPGLVYYQWHGSPRAYLSPYPPSALAAAVRTHPVETWCIFDNTGSGSAAGNALDLRLRLEVEVDAAPTAAASPARPRRRAARRSRP